MNDQTIPACNINEDGSKYWLYRGKLHREDGPAIVLADGTEFWYLNDKRHRANGPAVEYADGDKSWWFNGRQYYSVNDFCKVAKLNDEEKTLLLLKWQEWPFLVL